MTEKIFSQQTVIFLTGFLAAALLAAFVIPRLTDAQTACTLDNTTLTKLYDGMFHRPLDAGASGYVGHDINFILDQLRASGEHKAYTGLFSAVKALENAERESGELSETEKQEYKDIIDSALSTVNQWSKQLPEQARADAVVGPEQARAAIQTAYDGLNPTAKAAAEYGLFNALKRIGPPADLKLPQRP